MNVVVLIFLTSLLFGTVSSIPLGPGITVYIHDITVVLLFFSSLVVILLKKTFIRPKLLFAIGGFVCVGVLSLLLNTFRFSSWQLWQSSLYLLRWIAYAGLYIIIVQQVVTPVFLLWGLWGVGTSFAALGVVQYFLYPSLRNLMYLGWDPHYYRLFSTLLDPNFAGIILVLTMFLGFGFFIRRPLLNLKGDALKTSIFLFGLVVSTIALLLTYSRSSYLAFIAGALYLMLQSKQWRAKGIIVLLLFLFTIVVIPKPGGDTLRLDRMVTTIARVENWQQSIVQIKESPIIGFGFNTLRFSSKLRVNTQGKSLKTDNSEIGSKAGAGVDNSTLFILLTTGVLGFISYGWLVYKQGIAARLLTKRKKYALLGHIYIASLLAIFVHSMFVNSLFYPWIMIWMWIMTGIVESTLRRSLRHR